MMPIQKRVVLLALIICAVFAGALIVNKNYKTDKSLVLNRTELLFNKSIHIDKDRREKETPFFEILLSLGNDSVPQGLSEEIWEKHSSHYIKQEEDTVILIKRTDDIETLTSHEKTLLCEQMYLISVNPIQASVLDSIFSATLQENGIPAQTAVIYECDGVKQYSTSDSSFYASAIKLDCVTYALEHKIVLQPYVKLPFYYIVSQSILFYSFLFITWLLSVSLVVWIALRKKKSKGTPAIITPEPKQPVLPAEIPDGFIQMAESLLFNEQEGILKYEDHEDIILSGYKLKLFILLRKDPKCFFSIETIRTEVWGDELSTKEAIIQTIRRLRMDLASIPELKIINERSRGYNLSIVTKEEEL